MSIDYYRAMLLQRTRVEAFRRELAGAIAPGETVLEIGAGLGTYAFFAADAGAARVWAIEGSPVTSLARTLSRLNGYDDRVEILRGWYPRTTPPEPVDVVVFEDYPPRLLDRWTWEVLSGLRPDILKPGGRVIPGTARLRLAPVASDRIGTWIGRFGQDDRAYGIEWRPMLEYLHNCPLHADIEPEALAAPPVTLATVDLNRLPPIADLTGSATWRFERDTRVQGLLYWFDLQVGGVWLSNEPGGDPGAWGHLFLATQPPVSVVAGETLEATVGPQEAGGTPGWLTWSVRAGAVTRQGHEFLAAPASLDDLTGDLPDRIPRLSEAARLEARILTLADGTRTARQIAGALAGTEDAPDESVLLEYVLTVLQGRTVQGVGNKKVT